ncbi:MAG TPA: DinB family protein [bacterium]|jgi:uncharacterized damage-inducible protein DinB
MERQFLAVSASTLRDQYLPKIKEAVALLSEDELWAKENESTNSVGNLLMHLTGNVRQHILSGVGGRPDERNRPKEFTAHGGISKAMLLNNLETTVLEAFHVVATLDPKLLTEERVIQGNKVTLLKDIYHVVEHFAYHAGQIIYIVKAIKQARFPWYAHLEVQPQRL